jgi:hypothetical protein
MSLASPNPPAQGTIQGYVVSENFPGTVPAGVTQLDNTYGIRGEHQNSIDPRVGFAWRLSNVHLPMTGQVVLRGGYGIYHTRATGQPFIQLAAAPPFALLRQLQGAPNAAASFASPFGPDLTFPQFPSYSPTTQRSISFIDQAYRPPVTQQWSLNLQTELGPISCRGGLRQDTRHAPDSELVAQPGASASLPSDRGQTTNTVASSQRVPILGFTAPGLNDIASSASSWYHSMDVSLMKRLSKGCKCWSLTLSPMLTAPLEKHCRRWYFGHLRKPDDNHASYGLSEFNREHRLWSAIYISCPARGSSTLSSMFLADGKLPG